MVVASDRCVPPLIKPVGAVLVDDRDEAAQPLALLTPGERRLPPRRLQVDIRAVDRTKAEQAAITGVVVVRHGVLRGAAGNRRCRPSTGR